MATRPCNQPLKDGGRCSKRIGLKGRCGAEHAPAAVAVATRPTATVTAMNDPFATAMAPPSLPSDIEDLGAARAASDDVIAAKAHLIGRDHVRDRIRVKWIVNDITPEPDGWITIHGSHNSRGIAWGRWPDTTKTVHPDTGTIYGPDGFDRAGWKTIGAWPTGDTSDRHDSPARRGRDVHRDTGTIYGPDGFNRQGVDADGYRRDGFHSRTGFSRDGTHRNGTTRDDNGYDVHGRDSQGIDRFGRDADGYDRQGWHSSGTHRTTGSRFGPDGFDRSGRDADGYDRDGFDRLNWDRDGNHKATGEPYEPANRHGDRWGRPTTETHDGMVWGHVPGIGGPTRDGGTLPIGEWATDWTHPHAMYDGEGDLTITVTVGDDGPERTVWDIEASWSNGSGESASWNGAIHRPLTDPGDVVHAARRQALVGLEGAEVEWEDPRF